jgi:tetratricopeptide (TPR) repeat protein
VERLSIEAHVYAALRSDALRALGTNQAPRAITRALSMIERSPFDEAGHILLVKALVADGDTAAAQERAATCETLFRDELGVEPTAAVRSASRPSTAARVPGISAGATARSLLESGAAALDAGAPDAGLECLRQAVAAADGCGDVQLEAKALAALGSALVHAVRGFDDEGAVALTQAVELAVSGGDGALAATALTELGYVDVLAGRRTQAEKSLRQADDAAAGRADLLAGVSATSALNLADWGRPGAAADAFRTSLEHAEAANEPRRIALTLGFGARTLLELHLHDEATAWIERSLRLIAEEHWMSFRPWVEVLAFEQALVLERPNSEIRSGLEQTFALCVQLNDPCYEGMAARTIGTACARAGEVDEAFAWFADARTRSTRVTDTYVWVEASALHCEAELAEQIGDKARCLSASSDLLDHSVRHQLDGFADAARELTAAHGAVM